MSTPAMPIVQVFSPDGTLGDIPYDRLHDALQAGAVIARKAQSPDGNVGFIPATRAEELLKAGGKLLPYDMDTTPPEMGRLDLGGVLKSMGTTVKSQISALPGAAARLAVPFGAVSAGADIGRNMVQEATDAWRRAGDPRAKVGEAFLAALGVPVGVSASRMNELAEQGRSSEIMGEAAVPAVETAIAYAAPKVLPEIPALLSPAKPALRSAAEALTHPTEIPGRIAKSVVERIPEPATYPGTNLPAAGEFYEQRAQALTRRGREQAVLDRQAAREAKAQGQTRPQVTSSAPPVIESEGRPATWTNERVIELSRQGDPRAIQQGRLRQLILPENVGFVANKEARIVPSAGPPRSVTLFDAQGNPVYGPEAPGAAPPSVQSLAKKQLSSASKSALLERSRAMDVPEWVAGVRSDEIANMKSILRNPAATAEERAIAKARLDFFLSGENP